MKQRSKSSSSSASETGKRGGGEEAAVWLARFEQTIRPLTAKERTAALTHYAAARRGGLAAADLLAAIDGAATKFPRFHLAGSPAWVVGDGVQECLAAARGIDGEGFIHEKGEGDAWDTIPIHGASR